MDNLHPAGQCLKINHNRLIGTLMESKGILFYLFIIIIIICDNDQLVVHYTYYTYYMAT